MSCQCSKDYIVDIQILREDAIIPTRGSEKAAGYDLSACLEDPVVIPAGCNAKIGTGLAITPPEGYAGWILPRSGMATKRGLRPSNTPGLCDEDYTGEYIVSLYNDSDETQTIYPGDRIAQLVFLPYINAEFNVVTKLNETERGDAGFGSTGTATK